MAVIYDKETDMTELQRRVTAELKQREASKSSVETSDGDVDLTPSGGSNRMERLPGWVWLIIVGAVVIVGLFIAVSH